MGHALVGHYLPNCDPVHKISIISRGQALGYTISLPREDRFLTTKSALMDQMAMTLGGRAAEELVFHEVTTGAANDLEKVTATAKQMIMRYGMSEKLGRATLGRNHDMPFLGRDMGAEPDYSEEIAREIDDEIRRVIEEATSAPSRCSASTWTSCTRSRELLIERETIDKDQFERLLAGEPPRSRSSPSRRPRAPPAEGSRARAKPRTEPKPRPFPLPGATMQPPPEPEGANSAPPADRRARRTIPARRIDRDLGAAPAPERHGRRQRDARLLLGRRAFLHPEAAIAEARGMLDEGAAIVDVGGESTRPGSEGVSLDEELAASSPCSQRWRRAGLDRHLEGRGRARRPRGRRGAW